MGLTGVNISEHDRVWEPHLLEEFRQRSGLFVSRGMEVSTDMGHMIVIGLDSYDLRLRDRFAIEVFADLPRTLVQASLAAGYVAAMPGIFARDFAELELEMVQPFANGFALTVTPKLELSDYLAFPGGKREDAIFSLKLIPTYNFGGGIALSVEGQATVAVSTREIKTGEIRALTPILRLQKAW